MKKFIFRFTILVSIFSTLGAIALAKDINVFENKDIFKMKLSSIDERLDENIDNPVEYERAMNESLELFSDEQYEEMAEEIRKEQKSSKAYLKEYLSDIKCALVDSKNGYDILDEQQEKELDIIDKQILIYDSLEKLVDDYDEKDIENLFEKIENITSSMEVGRKLPIIPHELQLDSQINY